MVKYIKREREGSKLEFYYNEFVKRDWYKDKNLYDNRGRRIHYNEDGSKVQLPQSGLLSELSLLQPATAPGNQFSLISGPFKACVSPRQHNTQIYLSQKTF